MSIDKEMMDDDLSSMDDLDESLDGEFDEDFDDGFDEDLDDGEEDWDNLDDEFDGFEEETSPKKSELKRFLLIGVILIVGGGGYLFFTNQQGAVQTPVASGGGNEVTEQDRVARDMDFSEGDEFDSSIQQPTGFLNFNEGDDDFVDSQLSEDSSDEAENAGGILNDLSRLDELANEALHQRVSEEARSAQEDSTKTIAPVGLSPLTPMPDNVVAVSEHAIEDITENATETVPAPALPVIDQNAVRDEIEAARAELQGQVANTLGGVESKIDQLLISFEDFGKRIHSLETAQSLSSKGSGGSSDDYKSLSRSIKLLEKKVTALEKQKAVTVRSVARPTVSVEKPVTVKPVTAARRNVISTPAIVQTRSVERHGAASVSVPAPRVTVTSTVWVLKSAQPGSALVKKKSTGEMRSIKVGDNLESLGKIVSISPDQGRWIVQGHSGQIRQ